MHEAAERHREEVRHKLEAKLARIKPRFVSDAKSGPGRLGHLLQYGLLM